MFVIIVRLRMFVNKFFIKYANVDFHDTDPVLLLAFYQAHLIFIYVKLYSELIIPVLNELSERSPFDT